MLHPLLRQAEAYGLIPEGMAPLCLSCAAAPASQNGWSSRWLTDPVLFVTDVAAAAASVS